MLKGPNITSISDLHSILLVVSVFNKVWYDTKFFTCSENRGEYNSEIMFATVGFGTSINKRNISSSFILYTVTMYIVRSA
jgi:hypothetical protein